MIEQLLRSGGISAKKNGMTRICSVVPALAALLLAGAAAVPADANHDEDSPGLPAAEAAHDETTPVDADALPSNDLSTSMGSKISSPAAPSGSLHASPKILNNAGVSNDLKSVLQPTPKPAPAPAGSANTPAAAAPLSGPVTGSAEPAGAQTFDLEIAPPEAALETDAPKAGGVPARPGATRLFLPLLIGVGALVIAGGLFAARLLWSRRRGPSQ